MLPGLFVSSSYSVKQPIEEESDVVLQLLLGIEF
jgi:hypothetical protein